jgi:lipoate-protein ligase A
MPDPRSDSPHPRHAGSSQGAPAVAVCSVDAAEEQVWNQQQLAVPVPEPRARLWCYPQPAVVLGRAQHALLPALDSERCRIVARASGGGAVLVGPWMVGASVVLPVGHRLLPQGAIADSYRWLGALFVEVLARHGVAAQSMPRERTWKAPAGLAWACFAGMSPWEVVIGDRKLVGFAQRRNRHGVLLVGGALVATVPWARLCDAMRQPAAQAADLAAITIDASQVLGRPLPAADFAADVAAVLAAALSN